MPTRSLAIWAKGGHADPTMTRASFFSALALIVAAAFFAGCASGGKLGGVSISVVSIRSSQQDNQAVVTLRYLNENVVPIGIANSRHKLFINGTLAGQSVHNQALGLPQLAAGTQDVTLTFSNPTVISTLRGLAKQPQASYRLESVLFVVAGEEKIDIKTTGQGVVDLSGLATAAP